MNRQKYIELIELKQTLKTTKDALEFGKAAARAIGVKAYVDICRIAKQKRNEEERNEEERRRGEHAPS